MICPPPFKMSHWVGLQRFVIKFPAVAPSVGEGGSRLIGAYQLNTSVFDSSRPVYMMPVWVGGDRTDDATETAETHKRCALFGSLFGVIL